ncbi:MULTISPECIES: dCTP deaminase [Pseudonocardia]|nr:MULTISPECIES: dCTP deaminase [Pseudonocardia]
MQQGDLIVDPPPAVERLQPASIDVTLGDSYRGFTGNHTTVTLDQIPDDLTVGLPVEDGILLQPGDFVLATTAEHFTIPADLCAFLHGRSTLGRLGITCHVTAGLIDPGYRGHITLEVSNVGPVTILLRVGDPIGQVTFEQLTEAAARPYGHPDVRSRYQDQDGAAGPRAVPGLVELADVIQIRGGA